MPTDSNELTEQQNAQEPEESQEPPELERLTSRQASEKEIGTIKYFPAEPSSIRMGFAKEKRRGKKLQQKRNREPLKLTPVEQASSRVLELKMMRDGDKARAAPS